jgi:hypothetical protein
MQRKRPSLQFIGCSAEWERGRGEKLGDTFCLGLISGYDRIGE